MQRSVFSEVTSELTSLTESRTQRLILYKLKLEAYTLWTCQFKINPGLYPTTEKGGLYKMANYLQLLSAILLPLAGGWSTSMVMAGQVRQPGGKAWYQRIRKPVGTPRNAVFAPVWIVLYTSMGTASYVVYNSTHDFETVKVPLALYGIQLLLNFTWTPIFFGLHWLKTAFFEMLLLDAATIACTYSFYHTSTTAALLMSPYLAWLAFATCLNFAVWRLNSEPGISKKLEVEDYAAISKPL